MRYLVWRHAGRHVFVGDAKYKYIASGRIPNADLYQVLAYTTALGLPCGLVVYAEGERRPATYMIRNSGARLEVVSLDLNGSLEDMLGRIEVLAEQVRRMRDEAGSLRDVA